ncbi:MAG: recombinase family protein [Anaerolineales bacterium]|nr:recombinase family protein [Anaerolineales bacterium]
MNAREVGIRVAEQNNFTWEYIKEIGSGTTLTGRPEMMKILDRIAAGEIQVIIVQDLDRLARPEEAVVYTTIRNVIMEYGVIIYTHTARVDLNNDDDDFLADITMSVAKKERRRTLKRMRRGIEARAKSGKFVGGQAGLGYIIIGQRETADFAKNPNEVKLVELIFSTLEATGGNMTETAKRLNKAGYRGKKGKLFTQNTIHQIIKNKLYIGIFESKVTDKVTHRPDLQIISLDQFERIKELIKSRAGNRKGLGRRGRYIFTGFVACSNCGSVMVAGKSGNGPVIYQCMNRRKFGVDVCSTGQTISEHLILPPIIEFLTDFIQGQIDFPDSLYSTAAQYGKSITEEAIEAAIQGELASVQAGKERLVEAISLGILTNQEAAAKLAELREQEQRLTVELSSIAEKAVIMAEWQTAIEVLKGQNIADRLGKMAETKPIAFRRLLSFVFEPNSVKVKTERTQGRQWQGTLVEYHLTKVINTLSLDIHP